MLNFSRFDSKLLDNEVFLNFSSMYWLSGYGFLILLTIQGAKRIITTEPYSPAVAIRIIQDYKVNHYVSSPTKSFELIQSAEIEKADLSSVRFFGSIGSLLIPSLRKELMRVFKNPMIVNFYGSTETCGAVSYSVTDKGLGYVGRLIPGVEAKVSTRLNTFSVCLSEDKFLVVDRQ